MGVFGRNNVAAIGLAFIGLTGFRSIVYYWPMRDLFLRKGIMSNIVLRSAPPGNENNTTQPELSTIGWLSMGNAMNYPLLKARFEKIPNTKFFFHSFDGPCEGCIFKPKTTFSEGRHILLQAALRDPTIKYMVLIDDDMELICGETLRQKAQSVSHIAQQPMEFPPNWENTCWETYTQMLLQPNMTYPFIKPLDDRVDLVDAFTIKYQSCTDENFKSFHRDYLWFYYPSSYKNEEKSWWLDTLVKMSLTQRCLHHAWKIDGRWDSVNKLHRSYPQGNSVPDYSEILPYTYSELGPWNVSNFPLHRCEVTNKVTNIQDIVPLCETALKARYQNWLNGTFEPELAKSPWELPQDTTLYTTEHVPLSN